MEGDFMSALIKMAITFTLVVFLIVALLFLLKKYRLRSFSLKGLPEMRLISMLHLAPKRSIALVEVCGQWLLVGVGTENVALLTRLDPPPEAADAEEP